jgi:phage host-nuclease inhibitor protein Gam
VNIEITVDKDLVVESLDRMAEKQERLHQILAAKEKELETLLAPMKTAMAEVESRFAPEILQLSSEISGMEAGIKESVIDLKESVRGSRLHAVYAKGRVSWDNGKLEGYAAAGHPEILDFRSEGKPSVSMRTVALKEAETKS